MANRYKLQDVAQLQGRKVFIDANVLIYLFWPTGSYDCEQKYARVFSYLLKQSYELYVDFLVISETINRVLRNEYKRLNPSDSFKNFRNSPIGNQALNDIHIILKNQVLPYIGVIGKNFTKSEIESLLVVNELDFVDKSIVVICKENSLVLLTNDRDFKNADLEILTGNSNILN